MSKTTEAVKAALEARAAELVGCTENSREEQEYALIADLLEYYDGQSWSPPLIL